LVLFAAAGIFAEKYAVRIGPGMELSGSFLPFFLSAAILGPLASFTVAVASQLPRLRRGELESGLCFSLIAGLTTGATALLYWALLGQIPGNARALTVAGIGLLSGIFFQVLKYAFFVPVAWLRYDKGPAATWREGFRPFLPLHFFFLVISLGSIYVYRSYVIHNSDVSSPYLTLVIVLCLFPVLGLIWAIRAYAHQRELAVGNARLAQANERWALRNERQTLRAISSQVIALDLRDHDTARHSAAVAQWATDIATALKLSEREVTFTRLASLMHDVGKIGIPNEILLQDPTKLSAEESATLESHTLLGSKILTTIGDELGELAQMVLCHHERYDGKGYPMGVAGEEIPLISRIICVADSYSVMVSDKPYRAKLPIEMAKSKLVANRGSQFDPLVVNTFVHVLEQHDEKYQQGEAADFLVEFQKVKSLRDLPPESEEDEIAGD
jgi:HD-GYP domain-containing protein (c-di-GMP phosphodiesterase class II)